MKSATWRHDEAGRGAGIMNGDFILLKNIDVACTPAGKLSCQGRSQWFRAGRFIKALQLRFGRFCFENSGASLSMTQAPSHADFVALVRQQSHGAVIGISGLPGDLASAFSISSARVRLVPFYQQPARVRECGVDWMSL